MKDAIPLEAQHVPNRLTGSPISGERLKTDMKSAQFMTASGLQTRHNPRTTGTSINNNNNNMVYQLKCCPIKATDRCCINEQSLTDQTSFQDKMNE